MGTVENGSAVKTCFAACTGTKCPKFFSCEDHWGEPEQWDEDAGYGEGEIA